MGLGYGHDPRYDDRRNEDSKREKELKKKRNLEIQRQQKARREKEDNLKRNLRLNLDLNSKRDFLELKLGSGENAPSDLNSRCVSVDTTLHAPEGRMGKKSFKGKSQIIKFRCTSI